MRRPGGAVVLAIAAAVVGVVAGCAREEKLVRYKPFLAGLGDVVTGQEAVLPRDEFIDPAAAPAGGLVVEHADGSRTLIARSAFHLMSHIRRTLAEEDEKLFVEEVLSRPTREEYARRGLDAGEAFRTLKASEAEIVKLFNRMPQGEHSPTVLVDQLGERVWRVKLTGQAVQGLRWRGFDMVMERGNWKLRWFIQ